MKTKTMKKILAASVAAFMMCAAVPMNAGPKVSATSTITINTYTNDSTDGVSRTYYAYQIFSGTAETLNGNTVLTGIAWGNGVNSSTLLTKLVEANASGKPLAGKFDGINAQSTAADVAGKFEAITSDSELAFELSRVISEAINDSSKISVTPGTAVNVNDGYYLVRDDSSVSGNNSALSANYLMVAGNVTIDPKVDRPSIDKVIVEDSTEVECNTAAIGDTINYKLTSTVPNMTGYNQYIYVVEDTLSAGLTLQYAAKSGFTIKIGSNTLTDITGESNQYSDTGKSYSVVHKDGYFRIVFNNFIQYTAGDTITIEYAAKLNDQASLGATAATANTNTAKLTFSNNPNYKYDGKVNPYNENSTSDDPTDDTPSSPTEKSKEDTVYTYTASLKIQKNKSDGSTLQGAGFTLYKDEECTQIARNEVKSDTNGQLSFAGLDKDTYYIKETTVPTGYNAAPVYKLIISADVSETGCTWKTDGSTDSMFTITSGTGEYNATIVNHAGATLPGTGGIGTTIFYVSGGALVVGAAVVLITRKRMSLKEDKK